MEHLPLAIACAAAALSVWATLQAYRIAAALARRPSTAPQKCSCESRVSTLEADMSELEKLLQRMDARDRMRKVRAARDDSGEPDPHRDPAAWKAHMRRRRALGGDA